MISFPEDFESVVQETYEAILKEGDIAIDVGAHLGRHAIPMARQVGPTGRVFAFEPLPMCREALLNDLDGKYPELRARISVLPQALADFAGVTEFVVARDALAYSGLKERQYAWPTELERIAVEVKRLDDVCLDLPALRYLKIDAEGGEYHILKGAVQTLRKFRPVVAFEFGMNSIAEYHITAADMARFWLEQQYKVYGIIGNYLTEGDFIASARAQNIWDYLAVPAEEAVLERTIVQVLRRARVNWLGVNAGFKVAEDNGGLDQPPSLDRSPQWIRPLWRQTARGVLAASRFILRRQMSFNHAILVSLHCLAGGVRQIEAKLAEQEKRLAELERLVGHLQTASNRLPEAEQPKAA